MGNCCCHAESPCSSVEERSGLLKDDSKATVSTDEIGVVGTYRTERQDDIRKNAMVEGKAEAVKNGETESSNTQENGCLQKESFQTAMSSPPKDSELKEDSTRPQDENMKRLSADFGETELSQEKGHAAAEYEVFTATSVVAEEENPASLQDRVTDGISLIAEAVCTGKTPTRENITLVTSHDNDEESSSRVNIDSSVAKESGEILHNNEVSNAHLATASVQVKFLSVDSQEISGETLSTAAAVDSNNGSSSVCKQASPEDIKSHDVSESSPGPGPTVISCSGEEQDSAKSFGEQETTAPSEASESLQVNQDAKADPECTATHLKEVSCSANIKQYTGEEMKVHDGDVEVSKAKEEDAMKQEEVHKVPPEAETQDEKDEIQEVTGQDEQQPGSTDVKAEVKEEESTEDDLGNSEEDLYRGAEELSASQNIKLVPAPVLEITCLKVEDRCSLDPAVDILCYSEREWKGNTAKSALIRKGYKDLSQRFGSLRRVRGDNYCALRATLFQVLSNSTQLPAWLQEEDISMLLKQLEAQEGLISQWTFPGECLQGDGIRDANQQLRRYVELLQKKWQAAVDCSSTAERQQLCHQVFQGGEEELGLLEALKLLMLGRAVELHSCMQGGRDVPLFCLLLFARDSSDCPRSFFSNHLSHVGLSAGLEQVEMFLLGYALQCTIEVYRLYKADTEEFVTYYPDDHKDDWPSVCLVTEDDRHYNVPVVEAAELQKELNTI
ncbi:uncharacterized protein LOC113121388 [Mastacembelus armatus]|uniref:Uncharacterized LOC113121388 n=1 Tax=Mastacembelus armatus TaxID=205130 RepID=A0A3Q3LJX4_9TELE|nr:uncharacterized protein LOC113121388 [Mastacembelus armatus]XP_026147585.1 uncharacterized protein LOC113121388 [Mastacembelus armatus]XP_026147586.1 uncharacterized protein LOC113121388 [Mastacembelus armatus]